MVASQVVDVDHARERDQIVDDRAMRTDDALHRPCLREVEAVAGDDERVGARGDAIEEPTEPVVLATERIRRPTIPEVKIADQAHASIGRQLDGHFHGPTDLTAGAVSEEDRSSGS